jgi:formate C-acetyltransferase
MKCCEIIKDGGMGGFPSLYFDDALIPAMQRIGIPLSDARLYSNDGCQETTIPGKGDFYPVSGGGSIDFLAVLNSVRTSSNEYNTFQDLMGVYKAEIAKVIKEQVDQAIYGDNNLYKYSQVPWLSATLEGCIENAMDKTEGGCTYNYTGFLGKCFANAANSLASIKKLVYDENIISLADLNGVLTKNWEENERLRQLAINRVPKYGNDYDYVDSLAVEVADFYIKEVLKYKNARGGCFYPGFYLFTPVGTGRKTGATADGRKAGDSVSVHASPTVGMDLKGPTAVINSVSKICRLLPPEGAPLDIRFHPSALRGEEGTKKLVSFVKTYMDQGGIELQLNVVDSKTLRDAQKNPEQHKNLIVRVWGFSAYFVTLSPEYQENIIKRTEHL